MCLLVCICVCECVCLCVCVGLLDHVTVLIGVAVKGKATGGVINQPYYNYRAGPGAKLGRCVWGLVGLGLLFTCLCVSV